jgi:RNA polymerase sigma factor for flagellar operon FliA
MGHAVTPTSASIAPASRRAPIPVAELWRRFRESGDQRAREGLVVAYGPLVNYAARRVRADMPAHVDTADLVSYGLVGLISAIDRFRPERETKFDTYAMVRIRGAILDELRVLDWVPRSVRSYARDIERATVRLQYTLQRAPSEIELADELDLDIDELRSRLVEISNSGMAALDQTWNIRSSPREGTPRSARVAAPEAADPARLVEASELKDRVAEVIARLPTREQLVVGLHYYENLSLREIAELIGLSRTGAAQVHARAVQRLRSWIGDDASIETLVED